MSGMAPERLEAAAFPILKLHWPGFEDEIEAAAVDTVSPPENAAHGLMLIDGGQP